MYSEPVPTSLGASLLALIFPPRCVLCLTAGTGLCIACITTLPPAPELAAPPGFDSCFSLLSYSGATKQLVAALKFNNHRDAVGVLGFAMSQLLDMPESLSHPQLTVTWAPTSAQRRNKRGFDQAELLAGAVASSLGLRSARLLRRLPGEAQTGNNRADRLLGPQFQSQVQPPERVLIIDDVRTTGATLCAAADALIESGARSVHGLTLAVTLLQG
jgi:ComF family protein